MAPQQKQSPPPTPEQSAVIRCDSPRLVVSAYAGSGKTTVLVQYALQHPQLRILYLAYNRAIRDEAAGKFPPNVICKTAHQVAFASCGRPVQHKLQPNLRITEIADLLNISNWAVAKDVHDTLLAFLCSADYEMNKKHCPRYTTRALTEAQQRYIDLCVRGAWALWCRMIDPADPLPATHDSYLKQYQLTDPRLDRSFDAILLDEAQDANPPLSQIVLSQRCRVVLVGDAHQQIYRYRGACNSLNDPALHNATRLYLTQSFRFGPNVALVANALLEFKGETRPVKGFEIADRVVGRLPGGTPQYTRIHRTVLGVLETALLAARSRMKVYWVGGINGYPVSELEDIFWLSQNQPARIKNTQLTKDYRNYDEYQKIAESTEDREMRRAINLIERYRDIPAQLRALRQRTVEDEKDAEIIVVTAHRSKGLEWPVVVLHDDFPNLLNPELPPDVVDDETNLLYVASTRAQSTLVINSSLEVLISEVARRRKQHKQGRRPPATTESPKRAVVPAL